MTFLRLTLTLVLAWLWMGEGAFAQGRSAKIDDDIFLEGKYLSVGVSGAGSFGTASNAPFGFHPVRGRKNIGLSIDQDGFGTGNEPTTGDFFLPNLGEEGFTVGFKLGSSSGTAHNYTNAERSGDVEFTKVRVRNLSDNDSLRAEYVGKTPDGRLQLTQIVSFKPDSRFFHLTTTLKNIGQEKLYATRYMRSLDPEQDVDTHSSVRTVNTLISNRPEDSRSVVESTGSKSKVPVCFVSYDERSKASWGQTLENRDVYKDFVYDSPRQVGESVDRDYAIIIAVHVGDLDVGEETTFSFFNSLDADLEQALKDMQKLVADKDGGLIAGDKVKEPVDLPTSRHTPIDAIDVFDFTIVDGGAKDVLPLEVKQVRVKATGTGPYGNMVFRLNGPDAANVPGVYSSADKTITFSGLNISVADKTRETYAINAYYASNKNLSPGQTFELSIDGDTDLTIGGGTMMGPTDRVTNEGGSLEVVVTDQDGTLTEAAGVQEPVSLSSTKYSQLDAVDIFDFEIGDGGAKDGQPLEVKKITLHTSGTGPFEKVMFRLNGRDVTNWPGSYSRASNTLTFSGLPISVPNKRKEAYTVNAYYTGKGLLEGQTFLLTVDGDVDLEVGWKTLMGPTYPVTNGAGSEVDIEATRLAFTREPGDPVSGKPMGVQPAVAALDEMGNIDTDFSGTVRLTEESAGTLVSGMEKVVDGVATFSRLTYTATMDKEQFFLTARDHKGDFRPVYSSPVQANVVATRLVFTTQPGYPVSGKPLNVRPGVAAQDDLGKRDVDFSREVRLSAREVGGTLTGAAVRAVRGVAAFDNVSYAASPGERLTLIARSGALREGQAESVVVMLDFDVELRRGWNLISLPLEVEGSPRQVFPEHVWCYGFEDGAWSQPQRLEPGRGYIMYNLNDQNWTIAGQEPDPELLRLVLRSGWNLIGGGKRTMSVAGLQERYSGALTLAYGYDGAYRRVSSFQAGKGYWVFWYDPTRELRLDLSGAGAARRAVWFPEVEEPHAAAVLWAEAAGQRQELLLGVPIEAVGELPPLLPEKGLELRAMVDGRETQAVPELPAGAELPVRVRGDGVTLGWELPDGAALGWELMVDGVVYPAKEGSAVSLGGTADIVLRKVSAVPQRFALEQNFPNPFNPSTAIQYDLAEGCRVRLRVYDLLGQVVRVLVDEQQAGGRYRMVWDGRDEEGAVVANGVYVSELEAGEFRVGRKMMMMK
jgi:hypothetical protein